MRLKHFDEYGGDDDDYDSDNVTCNRCGESGLYWQVVYCEDGRSERNTLFSDATRKRHVCKVQDEFEVVK